MTCWLPSPVQQDASQSTSEHVFLLVRLGVQPQNGKRLQGVPDIVVDYRKHSS